MFSLRFLLANDRRRLAREFELRVRVVVQLRDMKRAEELLALPRATEWQ